MWPYKNRKELLADKKYCQHLAMIRGGILEYINVPENGIPAWEISDPQCLDKKPLVSVHMVTYNHAPFITKAIESVIAQKTNFDFELVIGEDHSSDNTLEMCMRLQKLHPDKIRVLHWKKNVSKLGGNDLRVFQHCRGKYIAFLEGDDFWTDDNKLQKQIDILEANHDVGLVFTSGIVDIYKRRGGTVERSVVWGGEDAYPEGKIAGEKFSLINCLGRDPRLGKFGHECTVLTGSAVIRADILREAYDRHPIFYMRLSLRDAIWWNSAASVSSVWFMKERTVVYNWWNGGVSHKFRAHVLLDSFLVKYHFMRNIGLRFADLPFYFFKRCNGELLPRVLLKCWFWQRIRFINRLRRNSEMRERIFPGAQFKWIRILLAFGMIFPWLCKRAAEQYDFERAGISDRLLKKYRNHQLLG